MAKTKRYATLFLADNPNVVVLGVKSEVNPYNGSRSNGFGLGYPALAGGNAERGEPVADTLSREVAEELHGRYRLVSVSEDPRREYDDRGNRYDTYAGRAQRLSRPMQLPPPANRYERAARMENSRTVEVDVTTLGLTSESSKTEILTAIARAAGCQTRDRYLDETQRAQRDIYLGPGNSTMQNLARDVRGRLATVETERRRLAQAAAQRTHRYSQYPSGSYASSSAYAPGQTPAVAHGSGWGSGPSAWGNTQQNHGSGHRSHGQKKTTRR